MQVCDFDGSVALGAPKGWENELDGECGTLYVLPEVDILSGVYFMYSIFKPTPADMAVLAAGGALRLGVAGKSHPIINMVVIGPEACTAAGVKPVWDM